MFTVSTFSGSLHLCMSCDLNSYYYTNTILQENQEELETMFLCRNKGCHSSNIVSGLFSPSSTINTFSGGLHLCMSYGLNSFFYTNAILQENEEKLETNFICKNKGLLPS